MSNGDELNEFHAQGVRNPLVERVFIRFKSADAPIVLAQLRPGSHRPMLPGQNCSRICQESLNSVTSGACTDLLFR